MSNKTELKLNCRESQLLLRAIPLDKKYSDMSSEEQDALRHYYSYEMCRPCKEISLTNILSKELSCKEALEEWAKKPGPLYLGSGEETLREILAVEHVWGKRVPTIEEEKEQYKERHGNIIAWHDNIDNCKNKPCIELMCYWMRASLSIFYDGQREIAKQIPFIISLFKEQGWPLDNLLKIQQERITIVLESLEKGKNLHNYHSSQDAIYEIEKNIEALQELVKKSKK